MRLVYENFVVRGTISVGYTMDTMYFGWIDKPVELYPEVQLPQFTLDHWYLSDCSDNYTTGELIITQQVNCLHSLLRNRWIILRSVLVGQR